MCTNILYLMIYNTINLCSTIIFQRLMYCSLFFIIFIFFLFFFYLRTTIPHGPLDILQAQEQVRHRGGDRRAHRKVEPGTGTEQVTRLTTATRSSIA
jgi:hypothetical protein